MSRPNRPIASRERARLRAHLKEGYIKRADRDKQIVAGWDHLSAEVWARLDRKEES